LRYLADKNSAHTQTDTQTDRHTPMTTRPCGLRRAGKNGVHEVVTDTHALYCSCWTVPRYCGTAIPYFDIIICRLRSTCLVPWSHIYSSSTAGTTATEIIAATHLHPVNDCICNYQLRVVVQHNSKPLSPLSIDTRQNAPAATSVLIDTTKCTTCSLRTYLFTHNRRPRHGTTD